MRSARRTWLLPLGLLFAAVCVAADTSVSRVTLSGTDDEALLRFSLSGDTAINTFMLTRSAARRDRPAERVAGHAR